MLLNPLSDLPICNFLYHLFSGLVFAARHKTGALSVKWFLMGNHVLIMLFISIENGAISAHCVH